MCFPRFECVNIKSMPAGNMARCRDAIARVPCLKIAAHSARRWLGPRQWTDGTCIFCRHAKKHAGGMTWFWSAGKTQAVAMARGWFQATFRGAPLAGA